MDSRPGTHGRARSSLWPLSGQKENRQALPVSRSPGTGMGSPPVSRSQWRTPDRVTRGRQLHHSNEGNLFGTGSSSSTKAEVRPSEEVEGESPNSPTRSSRRSRMTPRAFLGARVRSGRKDLASRVPLHRGRPSFRSHPVVPHDELGTSDLRCRASRLPGGGGMRTAGRLSLNRNPPTGNRTREIRRFLMRSPRRYSQRVTPHGSESVAEDGTGGDGAGQDSGRPGARDHGKAPGIWRAA
jgi:hypothetical protein